VYRNIKIDRFLHKIVRLGLLVKTSRFPFTVINADFLAILVFFFKILTFFLKNAKRSIFIKKTLLFNSISYDLQAYT
jgi:hypothetical protein